MTQPQPGSLYRKPLLHILGTLCTSQPCDYLLTWIFPTRKSDTLRIKDWANSYWLSSVWQHYIIHQNIFWMNNFRFLRGKRRPPKLSGWWILLVFIRRLQWRVRWQGKSEVSKGWGQGHHPGFWLVWLDDANQWERDTEKGQAEQQRTRESNWKHCV